MNLVLPKRQGERPETTKTNPHQQLNQHPPLDIIEEMHQYILSFKNVTEGPSHISVPGTPAFFLANCKRNGLGEGFLVDNEFVHIHSMPDGSLHLALPEETGEQLVDLTWGEPHVLAGMYGLPKTIYMLYAPRNQGELEVAKQFIKNSYEFAQVQCK